MAKTLILILCILHFGNALTAEQTMAAKNFKVRVDERGLIQTLRPLSDLKKDQYEKTADFTKRVCAATNKALGVDEKTPVTFVLEYGKNMTWAQYDADKQAFVITLGTEIHYVDQYAPYEDRWRWEPPIDKFKFNTVRLASSYKEAPKSYVGKNSFGVAKEIKVAFEDMVVLFFPTPTFNSHSSFIGSRILLPANADVARKLDGDLRIAIVARVQPPCFITGRSHTSPTVQYPRDITTFEMGIVVSAKPEWLLYRASTKDVLKRGIFK